jgi:dTDP-glucose 4,6-dehydratase
LRALGWAPAYGFTEAIEHTVRWYSDNPWWWEPVRSGEFRQYYHQQYGERLAEASVE